MPAKQALPDAAAQLTQAEVAALRELMERDRRVTWLWSTARTWAVWITAVAAGCTVGWDALKRLLQAAGKG